MTRSAAFRIQHSVKHFLISQLYGSFLLLSRFRSALYCTFSCFVQVVVVVVWPLRPEMDDYN